MTQTSAAWNDLSGDWQQLDTPEQAIRYRYIATAIRSAEAESVLDIGCGEGVLLEYLNGDVVYTGIEPSALAAGRARLGRGTILHAQCEDVTLDSTYDAIVFNEVLYYLPDPLAMLEKFTARLNPGGVLIVSIYQIPQPWYRWKPSPNRRCTISARAYLSKWPLTEMMVRTWQKTWWVAVAEPSRPRGPAHR
jgi:2-polyprenyl-3-methyl-5-hydroxy-6-metoxy-1,4-benzoquinol methylase